jgi:hypothetical protein
MAKTSEKETMKAALIVTAVWMLSCAALQGAGRGFDDMVGVISDRFQMAAVILQELEANQAALRQSASGTCIVDVRSVSR